MRGARRLLHLPVAPVGGARGGAALRRLQVLPREALQRRRAGARVVVSDSGGGQAGLQLSFIATASTEKPALT